MRARRFVRRRGRAHQQASVRQRCQPVHPRRRHRPWIRSPHRGRHGRRERADSRAHGLAWLRRLEGQPFWRLPRLRRRRRALLHPPEEHHATLARQYCQGRRIRHAHGQVTPRGAARAAPTQGTPCFNQGVPFCFRDLDAGHLQPHFVYLAPRTGGRPGNRSSAMSIQNLLHQILQSGKGLAQDTGSALNKSGIAQGSLGGFGGGALAGGALGLLLGNKKFRKMGGKLAGYGGAAALGALALKTYQDWQARQSTATPGAVTAPASAQAAPLRLTDVETPQMEQHSRAMLAAMIAAAKSDGHVGTEERQMIEAEIERLAPAEADMRWLHDE